MVRMLLVFAAAILSIRADVATVRAEPNLEKRSALALDQADVEIDAARKAYTDGEFDPFRDKIDVAGKMVDLSYESLQDSGKRARRNPKWFKRAEQKLMLLLRRLDNFSKNVASQDQPVVEDLRKRVSNVHDQVLHEIMTRK